MAKLDAIQLKIGLPLNIDPNVGQNKFEGHISKNVSKMAISWPKIASATLACTLGMVITWPFSSNFDKRIH